MYRVSPYISLSFLQVTFALLALCWCSDVVASSAKRGHLWIHSKPGGAKIYIDGKYVCLTPCRRVFVRSGKRLVSFVKPGFVTKDRFVVVAPGVGQKLLLVLAKRTSSVTLRSVPSGAKVMHKGKLLGLTPLPVPASSLRFSLQLSKPGYLTLFKVLQLKPAQRGVVTWRLRPMLGRLVVNTEAGPAEVWNGLLRLGTAPLSRKVRGGWYDLQLKAKGRITSYRRVFVAPLRTTKVFASLPPKSCSSLSTTLVNGKREGPHWRCWSYRYWLTYQRFFQGKLHGASIEWYQPTCTTFHDKGRRWRGRCSHQRKSEGSYHMGRRVGTWLFWSRTGVRTKRSYKP